ncbi:hypothetical protein G7Y89_g5425 [Cudoniella acicularis]|uniref:DUF7702 domain-containing protein n=1 Tax=Cudoniella acicularis TaxID=354080 RepID=A0A8H4RNW3_9HELO|nr:hypothetical protein G7Y89_g5425 [Cudoniella acicularis]
MHLDDLGYISIAELIVYLPCLILGFLVCLRHGFKRTSGWIFILILSTVRIVGATCQLLTYSHPTEGLLKATLIFDSIGIAPLLLAVLGVLSRFVDWVNASEQIPKFNTKLFRVLQLVISIGLILGIIGVTSGGSWAADGSFTPSTVSKVGIIVYIFVLAALTIIFILELSSVSVVPSQERILTVHIPIALLAIAVRLLYSTLCIFVHDATFSLFGGSITANVLMAIVEEFFVVIITLALGFKLRRISASAQDENMNQDRRSRFRRNHGRQPLSSKDGIVVEVSTSELVTFSSV